MAADQIPSLASLVGRSTRIEAAPQVADVATFGAITRDDHPIHVDEAFARSAGLDGCIVQGSLFLGLMAGASTKFFRDAGRPVLSYGYDRLRFVRPLPVGATAFVEYTITEADEAAGKTVADVTVRNARDELLAVARHICKAL